MTFHILFCSILSILFYSIFYFIVLSLKMLGVIISIRSRSNDLLCWQMEQPLYSLLLIYCDRCRVTRLYVIAL